MPTKDLLEEGYVLLHDHKAYSVMYNIIDCTSMDRSNWKIEEKDKTKNFINMLVIKIWPHSIKPEYLSELPTGKVLALSLESFDTLLECKDWAVSKWDNREGSSWWEEVKQEFTLLLKDKYLEKGKSL